MGRTLDSHLVVGEMVCVWGGNSSWKMMWWEIDIKKSIFIWVGLRTARFLSQGSSSSKRNHHFFEVIILDVYVYLGVWGV